MHFDWLLPQTPATIMGYYPWAMNPNRFLNCFYQNFNKWKVTRKVGGAGGGGQSQASLVYIASSSQPWLCRKSQVALYIGLWSYFCRNSSLPPSPPSPLPPRPLHKTIERANAKKDSEERMSLTWVGIRAGRSPGTQWDVARGSIMQNGREVTILWWEALRGISVGNNTTVSLY